MPKDKKKKPLERHKALLKTISENIGTGMSFGEAMRKVGYSKSYSESPEKVKETKSWDDLMAENLPDSLLATTHKELLRSSRLDHMVFPLGPKDEASKEEYIAREQAKAKKAKRKYEESEFITDEDIKEMLLSVNCTVKKIVHMETGRHVYFWSADNMARDKALDKGYKLKGKYEPDQVNVKFGAFTKEQLIELVSNKLRKK